MQHRAILFGAIGTIADTSDMQREAFNRAFREAGLDWNWSRDAYAPMLATVGGQNRIAAYAAHTGDTVDAAALHAAKSEIYQRTMRDNGITLRPGVSGLIAHARDNGLRTGWITTTSRRNIDAIIDASRGALDASMFDLITDRSMVDAPKPDPAVYWLALDKLNLKASGALAIEDTPESAQAAAGAGLDIVAFEGAAPPGSDWPDVVAQVSDLSELLDQSKAGQAA